MCPGRLDTLPFAGAAPGAAANGKRKRVPARVGLLDTAPSALGRKARVARERHSLATAER